MVEPQSSEVRLASLVQDAKKEALLRGSDRVELLHLAATIMRLTASDSQPLFADWRSYIDEKLPPPDVPVDEDVIALLTKCEADGLGELPDIAARLANQININMSRGGGLWTQASSAHQPLDREAARAAMLDVVVGQDAAVDVILDRICMCRRQLDASPHQPDALIIIDGPRGNGKTLIAQELAKALFGEGRLLHYQDAGLAINEVVAAMDGKGDVVVLFDRIDKTNASGWTQLWLAIETGRYMGKPVDLSKIVIVATVDTAEMVADQPALRDGLIPPDMREQIMTPDLDDPEAYATHFEPGVRTRAILDGFGWEELTGRADEIIQLEILPRQAIATLVERQLARAVTDFAAINVRIAADDAAKQTLTDESHRPEFGARDVERVIEARVRIPASKVPPGSYALVVREGLVVLESSKP